MEATQATIFSEVRFDRLNVSEHASKIVTIFKISIDENDIEKKCIKTIIMSFKETGFTKILSCDRRDLEKLKDVAGKTLLMHAAKPKNQGLAIRLIQDQIGIHGEDNLGNTALHYAARRGAIDVLSSLLGPSRFDAVNSRGETPLHIAIKAGQDQVIFTLINRFGQHCCTPLGEDGLKFTPLALATKYGKKKCADLLLDPKSPKSFFQKVPIIGSLLHVAVWFRQPEMVEYLLYSPKVIECLKTKNQRFNEFIEKENEEGRTALSLAASLGDNISIQLLFEKGASLETKDSKKRRPIYHAAKAGQFETVQFLVKLGAKIKVFDFEGYTPIEITRNDQTSTGCSIFNFLRNSLQKVKDYQLTLHQCLPENYVFKGGGPKGIAYAGVVNLLAEKGLLSSIKRFAGTSAGAIPAVFLALGCPSSKMEDILKNTNLLNYLDPPGGKDSLNKLFQGKIDSFPSVVGVLWNLVNSLRSTNQIFLHPIETLQSLHNLTGICEGEDFRKWVEKEITEITGCPFLTFGELRKFIEVEGKPYKHITLFGTRLQDIQSKSCCVKFSSEDPSCDAMIISDVLRISLSIPGVFRPHTIHIKHDNERVNLSKKGSFVDGGLLNNLPIETFDYKSFQSREELGKKGFFPIFNRRTVGFDLYSKTDHEKSKAEITTLFELLKSLTHIYMEAEENIRRLNPYASSRIIKIDIGDIGLLDFDLKIEQKQILIDSGYNATKAYFDQPIFQATSNTANFLKASKGYLALPPLLPEQLFDGREKLFQALQSLCITSSWTVKTVFGFVSGSKLNKAEPLIAFAYKNAEHFSIMKWINCESPASLIQGYQELAEIIPVCQNEKTYIEQINMGLETGTFTEKEQAKPWLLILDNVSQDLLEKHPFPKTGGVILCIYKEEHSGDNEIILNTDPIVYKYHTLADGLNLEAICINNDCKMNGKKVFIHKLYGSFNIFQELCPDFLPCCNQLGNKIWKEKKITLKNCEFSTTAINDKEMINDEEKRVYQTVFDIFPINLENWEFFNITVKQIGEK